MNTRSILLSAVLAASTCTAFAQKAALVKDMDANGRIPYVNTVTWSCPLNNAPACADHVYSFPTVPSGYRLVVGYVSAQYMPALSDPSQLDVTLNNGQDTSDAAFAAINLPGSVCSPNKQGARNTCVSAGTVQFYVEPGMVPKVVVHTGDQYAFTNNSTRATVVGYLISAN